MISTSGSQLLPDQAVKTLADTLLPQATVLTPNIPEAKLLAQVIQDDAAPGDIESVEDIEKMAEKIRSLGPKWVLLKGGHLPLTKDLTIAQPGVEGKEPRYVIDVLCGEGQIIRIQSDYQESQNTHGTGCTLACKEHAIPVRGVHRPRVLLTSSRNNYSGHRIQSIDADGCPQGRSRGLPIRPTRYCHSAGIWQGPRTFEPFP